MTGLRLRRPAVRARLATAILLGCMSLAVAAEVRAADAPLPGVEVLARFYAKDLAGRRVGILTNPTGVDSDLVSTIDRVRKLPGVQVVRLFAPEHGLRGGFWAGDKVDESKDPVSGLPIVSLYGATRRPSRESIQDLDAVLYDIQDVGIRHYTFVSSLTYMMEECEKAGVEVWVLDRPEPLGGARASGPMMDGGLISFIGVHAVPKSYGMTPGEWARMIQAERTPGLKLRVVPMSGWKRGMTYGDLGWLWIPPSQHIPRWETSAYYAITGVLGEGGRLNVGVGTPLPFEQIGAPGLNGVELARVMNGLRLPGVLFRPTTFAPKYAAFTGVTCTGIQIHIRDFRAVDPERVSLELMAALNRLHPDMRLFADGASSAPGKASMFMKALGDTRLGQTLAEGGDPHAHLARSRRELEKFIERRAKYLLYD